jgi:arginine decarboxylase
MSGIDERAGDSRDIVFVKNRVPFEYFVTEGTGQSNNQVHAGSYHLALRAANIEHLNVMKYSSILPEMAKEVRGFDPRTITHGSVLETISAEANAEKGQRATAALIWAKLRDPETGSQSKGLVCEYKRQWHNSRGA